MKFKDHTPDAEPPPVREAAKVAATALVQSLVDQRVRDGLFVLIVLRGGVLEPLHSVQMCSNLPPERVHELCRIIGTEAKPAAPQIIVPGNNRRH